MIDLDKMFIVKNPIKQDYVSFNWVSPSNNLNKIRDVSILIISTPTQVSI